MPLRIKNAHDGEPDTPYTTLPSKPPTQRGPGKEDFLSQLCHWVQRRKKSHLGIKRQGSH